MMWYGRMTFRAKDEDETRSAALMTLALHEAEVQTPWASIYDTTEFFAGRSDDPGFEEYAQAMHQVYGEKLSLKDISQDDAKWPTFLAEVRKIEGPAINLSLIHIWIKGAVVFIPIHEDLCPGLFL